MESEDLITKVLVDHDGLSSTVAEFRARVLGSEQEVVDYVRNAANWDFKFKTSGDIVVAAGDDLLLPTDYQSFGNQGGLFFKNLRQQPLEWIPTWRYVRLLWEDGQTASLPTAWAHKGVDPATGQRQIGFFPVPTQALTFVACYWSGTPTITDDSDGALALAVPPEWHTMLYHGVCQLREKEAGNIQSRLETSPMFMAGLSQMKAEEPRGQQAPHRLVPFRAGRSRR